MSRRRWARERASLFSGGGRRRARAAEASHPGAAAAEPAGGVPSPTRAPATGAFALTRAPAALARAAMRGAMGAPESVPTRLVGRDFAPVPTRVHRPLRPVVPLVVGTVLAALLLVSLRVEILRLRYAVAEAAREEERLLERKRQMTVRVRELRDPSRLRSLAAERGFTRPVNVLTLTLRDAVPLPPVATAPGEDAP